MMVNRHRRSLSNIIGAVILIAATIVGGLMVYSYFQRSMNAFMSMGSRVTVEASATPTGSGTLLYVKIINNEPLQITVKNLVVVLSNGGQEDVYIEGSPSSGYSISTSAPTSQGVTINPGGEIIAVGNVNLTSTVESVYLLYEMNNQVYYTNPVSVTAG
ncbi:archaellin/type IV pilin N-terminal domain-containing protein [Acidilobus sp.]|uniref:archaellin/type IV pilin N-terminal domain-containing protein n=1 Tax=Acidilobus sp. TaxID=1872109 RepID=UPI003CFC693B